MEADQQSQNLTCLEESYDRNFAQAEAQVVKSELQNQALNDGFKLVMDTGKKGNCIYYICNRGGKIRETESVGKRSKKSIKIGKNTIYLDFK